MCRGRTFAPTASGVACIRALQLAPQRLNRRGCTNLSHYVYPRYGLMRILQAFVSECQTGS